MPENAADALLAAIDAKDAPVCVGFDPVASRLPEEIKPADLPTGDELDAYQRERLADAFLRFGFGVIEATADLVPAIKINIAFFEPLRGAGVDAFHELVARAHSAGMMVIGDVKRADIGHTTERYAVAQMGREAGAGDEPDDLPDFVTVNPYFGIDGVKPFLDLAAKNGRGVFLLVQTSNASASEVQGIEDPSGTTLCQNVAKLVDGWAGGEGLVGDSGYSAVGAVVSPRDLPSTERIRELMPRSIFLVPGFGAQGRSAEEVARCFDSSGRGAIVNASRSVIFAYEDAAKLQSAGGSWTACVREACKSFVSAVRDAVQSS